MSCPVHVAHVVSFWGLDPDQTVQRLRLRFQGPWLMWIFDLLELQGLRPR